MVSHNENIKPSYRQTYPQPHIPAGPTPVPNQTKPIEHVIGLEDIVTAYILGLITGAFIITLTYRVGRREHKTTTS